MIKENNFTKGILVLNILHTSCSLTMNENADPNVLRDLNDYLEAIVPYNSYKDLNILVTGSSGFVGRSLVKVLLSLGSNVKEIDINHPINSLFQIS